MQAPKKTTAVREGVRAKAGLAVETLSGVALDQQALDEGRKPLASRRKDLAELRAKATELYAVPSAGLGAIPAIERGFQFSPAESDRELNDLHVAPLLDQAAALLERCAAARSQRDQLQMEKWKLQIELDRFFRLDQIQERERRAGLDTLPYERAALEGGAESSLETNYKSAEAEWKELTEELVASGFNRRMAARELAAWLSAYPLKDSELRGDDANYTFDGLRKTKPEHLFEAARMEADEAAWIQLSDLMARRFAAMAQSDAGRLRRESLDAQAKWSLAGIGFRSERSQAERDALWEKVFQAQSAGGLFNYSERIAPVERHFSVDFREAVARLTAARRGLKDLYDYAPPFPREGADGYFDDVTIWVRAARNWLTQFSQMDQSYVLAVSLKDLAKTQWESGRAAAQWTFDLPAELFEGQAHVRLRGLGVAVAGEPEVAELAPKSKAAQNSLPPAPKPLGYWSGRISVPAASIVRHISGTSSDLDQKSLPPCYFGRVMDRDSSQQPEIAGSNVLQGASPIGKEWKLTLSPRSTDGTPTASLHDVQIFLHVTVRGTKARS
jgi:hypothetical protein